MKEWPKPSRSRAVGYVYEGREFCESRMEEILERARRQGVVTEFDTGRGRIVWFNGLPGEAMRKLKAEVEAQIALGVSRSPPSRRPAPGLGRR